MTSQREKILAHMAAVLTTASPGGASVTRTRTEGFVRSECPAIVIAPLTEADESIATGLTRHVLDVELEVHVRADVPDQAADAILVDLHTALMANPTLGGLCARITATGTKWEFDDADTAAAKVTAAFSIIYLTPWSAITQQA